MVSTKALAAIALTLIIVTPIGIGFLTAVHQEDVESWETTTSSKISDLMLNHQTPYYGSYKGASNNASLWKDGAIVSPEYVTTTSSFTSLPIYEVTTTTVTLPQSTNVGSDLNLGVGPTAGVFFDGEWPATSIGVHDYYCISTGNVVLYETGYSGVNDFLS